MPRGESFLGIQYGSGEVIPIDIREVVDDKFIFSLPDHNAKQQYLVVGSSSKEMNSDITKVVLQDFIIPLTKPGNEESCSIKSSDRSFEIIDLTSQAEKYRNNSNMNNGELMGNIEELLTNSLELYINHFGNRGVMDIALSMMHRGQVEGHNLYPDLFNRIVLPGLSISDVLKIDKNADVMSLRSYREYINKKLSLLESRKSDMS